MSDTTQRLRLDGEADLHALHAARPDDYPFLLESGHRHARTGRYSLLFGECGERREVRCEADLAGFFRALPALDAKADSSGLPFAGGWFFYLGYELARHTQPHLAGMPADGGALLAAAVYCGGALIVDHLAGETWIVSEAGAAASHRRALEGVQGPAVTASDWSFAADPPVQYCDAVARAVDYIRAGDIYQANLSRRWQGPTVPRAAMADAYARLRARNPAPFAASAIFGDLVLASASPERLVRVGQGCIETRPIAGTRPRGADADADRRLCAELLANAKEQAEHIMLVDLERHDLGRLCRGGSVVVEELLTLESYASVHHIVSNIAGTLRPEVDVQAIIAATFPGGTITGCPKIRCMQIIAELEGRPRGAYTGSVGYISRNGRMDSSILIRTLVWQDGRCHFNAGAGIVADSQPASELAETEAKAAGLIRALAA